MDESRAAAWVAASTLAVSVLLIVCVAGAPLDTSDLWWHLKMGEVYTTEGPWPDGDPLLHTAHDQAPVQHEWLFGVAVHALDRWAGFHGLRLVHAIAVAAILALAYSIFRRGSGSSVAACCATSAFIVLAWPRLALFRPDLVSIPAVLLVYRLLLEPGEPPGARRITAAVLLLVVWANAHSLFLIGPMLLVAALIGIGLRAAVSRRLGIEAVADDGRLAGRLATALVLGLLATLANPRGIEQHLTFLTSSTEAAIFAIRDEWTPFDPLHFGRWSAVTLSAWVVADGVLVLFALTASIAGVSLLRRRSAAAWQRIDFVLFGLGVAGVVAALASVRFLWMLAFPLLFLLRALRLGLAARPAAAGACAGALAAISALLAVAFLRTAGPGASAEPLSTRVRAYFEEPYTARHSHFACVGFLDETGLEGNLFNRYGMGGFLAYWFAPRLRTFVDGRTEHYPPSVLRDYFQVSDLRGAMPGESHLDVLDRRRVDVFFGVGLPLEHGDGKRAYYTTAHLERTRGWLLVFRAIDCAIYLRQNAGNAENLERVTAYYAREGVPFDAEGGLDPATVMRERPDWAIAHRLLPRDPTRLTRARQARDPETRWQARSYEALVRALAGDYEGEVAIDRRLAQRRPGDPSPRRRLVFGLLHLGRHQEALAAALELQEIAPDGAEPVVRAARRAVARERARRAGGAGPEARALWPAHHRIPLLSDAEAEWAVFEQFEPGARLPRARRQAPESPP